MITDYITVGGNDSYHYFSGYYDKRLFNREKDKILMHRVRFCDRFPNEHDQCEVGFIEVSSQRFIVCGATAAWNWQQGAHLSWVLCEGEECLSYNIRTDKGIVGIVETVKGDRIRTFNSGIQSISESSVVSISYAKLFKFRKDYGVVSSKDDNIFLDVYGLDNRNNYSLPQDRIEALIGSEQGDEFWVNHAFLSPCSTKVSFLVRHKRDSAVKSFLFIWEFTTDEISCWFEGMISHYCWSKSNEIIAWAGRRKLVTGQSKRFGSILQNSVKPIIKALGLVNLFKKGVLDDAYYCISKESYEKERFSNLREFGDGHCNWMANKGLLVTDTYPDSKGLYHLLLYSPEENILHEKYGFIHPRHLHGELRIDLHPKIDESESLIVVDTWKGGYRTVMALKFS